MDKYIIQIYQMAFQSLSFWINICQKSAKNQRLCWLDFLELPLSDDCVKMSQNDQPHGSSLHLQMLQLFRFSFKRVSSQKLVLSFDVLPKTSAH